MELSLRGTETGIEVKDAVFGRAFNEPLIHQVVTAYLAAGRAGTRAQKTRAEVRGGGRKPWRQKGTGRARAGTTRSPLWRGGGRTFAARPQDYAQKVNRKMYRGAMCSILSELIRQDRLVVVEALPLEQPKTRAFLSLLQTIVGVDPGMVLIVTDAVTESLDMASRNLPRVELAEALSVDPVSLVAFEKVIMTVGALRQVEERFA